MVYCNPVIFGVRGILLCDFFYAGLKGKYELDLHGSSCTSISVLTIKIKYHIGA